LDRISTLERKQVDCIIVGQGLAGSAIAAQFLLKGRKVLVIDEPSRNNSSIIAAGLFNPITGKKMNKTWLADDLFPYLSQFYKAIEDITTTRFFYCLPIYRPFINIGEQNEWMSLSDESHLSGFVKDIFTESQYPGQVYDPYGGLLLNQSGYIDTKKYLAAIREWLSRSDSFIPESFDYDALKANEDGVEYKDFFASHIIFCEGPGVGSNKFFNWVPISRLKGETITIKAKFLDSVLVNRGVYVVPGGTDEWRVGSTYKFNPTDDRISEEGRTELKKSLESLIKVEYNVIHQEAGFRPVTPDRKPLLGKHPEHPTVLIFNGMGTKGVSLTPYFSDMLFQSLNSGGVIKKEVDISRFKSLYWKSR
jgi:glycine/D-amino acid oxidase-like deaminating enzyme